jgi:hypothetical protein
MTADLFLVCRLQLKSLIEAVIRPCNLLKLLAANGMRGLAVEQMVRFQKLLLFLTRFKKLTGDVLRK